MTKHMDEGTIPSSIQPLQLHIMDAPTTPLPIDIDLLNGDYGVPCEYRLMHIATGMFIGASDDGTQPNLVQDWRDASYFGATDHHIPSEEGTLEFQWNWMRDEVGEEWMHEANMNDYRVHVVIGESFN